MLRLRTIFLTAALHALPLAAAELTVIEPLSGIQQTLRISPANIELQRSAMEIWFTDAVRGHRFSRPDAVYIPSQRWLSIAAQYETAEFRDNFLKRAEYVKKGEQLFQEALVTSGLTEQLRVEGKLVILFQANYASLKIKPYLAELLLKPVDMMMDGYHSPETNDCGESYGCQIIVRFRPGTLEPDVIDIEAVSP